MGRDKASIPIAGRSILERAVAAVREVCPRVLVVGSAARRSGGSIPGLGAEVVPDVFPRRGPLGGLYSALRQCTEERLLLVGCDMPFLSPALLRLVLGEPGNWEAVVPLVNGVPQTLHAAYSRECLPAVEELMRKEGPGLVDLLKVINVRYLEEEPLKRLDPQLRSFFNVNTEGDLARAQEIVNEDESGST